MLVRRAGFTVGRSVVCAGAVIGDNVGFPPTTGVIEGVTTGVVVGRTAGAKIATTGKR